MSYLVLARKYRPRRFTEMVGQAHVVQALANALAQQRLHHAYLFTGTRGVGKTTVSRILAKSLNCTGPDGQGQITDNPCGVCEACLQIDSGRFVDYTELDAASNRGVDEVQALLEQAVYKPVQGRFKVFMIDEVHMLSNTAFNAMLKTLEEPPDYLKFVLATTDPQKVPVTVLSRCLQFNLRPMAPETVREHLAQVLQAEQVASEPGALRLLARAARGSMRDALSLTDQAIAFGGGALSEAGVRQMLGSVDGAHVRTLIAALALGDGRAVVQAVDALRAQGLSAAGTLEDLTAALQRMAVLQVAPEAAGEDDTDWAELARQMPPDETQLLYSLCLHGRAELGLAPDEHAALLMVLLRLLAFKPSQTGVGGAEKKSPDTAHRLKQNSALTPVQLAKAAINSIAIKDAPKPAHAAAEAAAQAAAPGAPVVQLAPISPISPISPIAPPAEPNAEPAVERPGGRSSADSPAGRPVEQPGEAAASHAAPSVPAAAPPAPDSAPHPPSALDSPADVQTLPLIDPAQSSPRHSAKTPESRVDRAQAAPEIEALAVRTPAQLAPDRARSAALDPARQPSADDDFWAATVQQIVANGSVVALARELALQSQLLARDETRWLLRVERSLLDQGAARQRLSDALASLGHPVQLAVEVGRVSDSPALRAAAAAAAAQQAAQQVVLAHPFVQQMMRDFGATIVAGSVQAMPTPAADADSPARTANDPSPPHP